MVFDPRNPLEIRDYSNDRDLMQKYFDLEVDFMVVRGYHREEQFIAIRSIAIEDIDKYTFDEPDALVPFLAINFVDRFLSRNINIPVMLQGEGLKRNVELFAFCCVSIASKICCSNFSFSGFLNKHQVAEVKDISAMELHILEGLNQRVQPVTAITFVYFLLPRLKMYDSKRNLAICVILDIQRDIRYTKFRPSTLAASAILATSYKIQPVIHAEFLKMISASSSIDHSEVAECFDELMELVKPDHMRDPSDKRPRAFKGTYVWGCVTEQGKKRGYRRDKRT